MLFKALIPLTLLILSPLSNANTQEQGVCNFLKELTPYQQDIAYQSYRAGEPYDLGLTAIAVAWKESKLGKYKVRFNSSNIKDVSVGVMHTVAYWKTKGMSSFESGQWVQDMLEVDQKSIAIGVQDLLYWQSRAKGNWLKGVSMYNGGYKPNYTYGKDIVNIVKQLKECKF